MTDAIRTRDEGNPGRRCVHGKLFTESCPGCGYIHPRDRSTADDLTKPAIVPVTVNDDNHYSAEDMAALTRLVKIGHGNTGQSGRVANFLLAWWNASRDGGFDLVDLWSVDLEIAQDMLRVFALIANCRNYPDHYGMEEEFRQLVTSKRRPKRTRKARAA